MLHGKLLILFQTVLTADIVYASCLHGMVAKLWFEPYGLKTADVYSLLEAQGLENKATLKNTNNAHDNNITIMWPHAYGFSLRVFFFFQIKVNLCVDVLWSVVLIWV